MQRVIDLPIGEDVLVEWRAAKNSATDEFVNDATMRFTLKDAADADVSGAVNLTMDYVAGSDGIYQGTLPASVTSGLTEGATYWVVPETTSTPTGKRKIRCKAVHRGAL